MKESECVRMGPGRKQESVTGKTNYKLRTSLKRGDGNAHKIGIKKIHSIHGFFYVNNYSRALTLFNLLGNLGSTNAMEDGIKLRQEVMRGRMVRSCQDHQFVVGCC